MGMTIFRNNKPTILIDRHIGDDAVYGPGISGADFVRELNMIENAGYPECEVWINSIGGSVFDGMDIYNAIVQANNKMVVNTRNVGVALSTAGWIMQAGKTRICNYYAKLMMHNSSGGDEKTLNAINESIVSMLSSRCNKSDVWIKDRMADETWMNAEDAIKQGLYDVIDENCGVEVKNEFEKLSAFAAYNKYRLVVNKLIEEPKEKMIKVKNTLGLDAEASEDTILKEINNLKAQIETLNKTVKDKENEIARIAKEKSDATIEVAANALVDQAEREGRISTDSKVGFLALAKIDFEGTKTAINALPVKSIANKIPVVNNAPEGRAGWDYSKWEKEDPKGLINMYKNSREQYDALLEKYTLSKVS